MRHLGFEVMRQGFAMFRQRIDHLRQTLNRGGTGHFNPMTSIRTEDDADSFDDFERSLHIELVSDEKGDTQNRQP